jgi:hypothetical protein
MERYTWREIIDLNIGLYTLKPNLPFDSVGDFLKTYGVLGALALSVAKWHDGNPEHTEAYCGLCLMFDDLNDCADCPLQKLWGMNCFHEDSPYRKWECSKNGGCTSPIQEQQMFYDLMKLYKKEYQRCKKEGTL